MRKLNAVALLLFFAITSPLTAADLNIGVVSLARLLSEAPQAQQSLQLLQNEFEPRKEAIRLQDEELTVAAENLRNDAAAMSDSDKRDAQFKLREKQRDIGRQQESYLNDFNRRRNEALGKLQRSLMDEVNKFAEQHNFDLIIGEGVLFASSSVDVTSQVLSALQASHQNSN